MKGESVEALARPRVLLAGDAAARPTGLERALTRAGFQLVEREDAAADPEADAILITLNDIAEEPLPDLLSTPTDRSGRVPPRIVLLAATNRDGPATALALGASDALAAPVHLPELCARLHARIRDREEPGALNGREPGNEAGDLPDQKTALEELDRRVREEFERARRYSLSFSLILLGVDEFRGVHDRLGQETADRLRRDVGNVLRRELRLPDFVVAYGSDEFAIVLPETGQTGARQSVIRVRERLAALPSQEDPQLDPPRLSAGIVTYPHSAISQTDDLYALAEAALMRGKSQAGERIGVAV